MPQAFAIGDIVGQPMLAHKAVHEAHVAAEVIAGELQGNKDDDSPEAHGHGKNCSGSEGHRVEHWRGILR